MTSVAVDPEQQAAQIIRSSKRHSGRRPDAAGGGGAGAAVGVDPAEQHDLRRADRYRRDSGTAVHHCDALALDWSAKICVVAFSVAIPLLTALILVNRQETFRRRVTNSLMVRVSQAIARLLAFVGVVAGSGTSWLTGVGILISSFVAMMVHSAGYCRL